MNHNLSDNSANVHPSGQAVVDRESHDLNPAIEQALGCLDIKLEDELTRFRSHRTDPLPERQLAPVATATWDQSEDAYVDQDIFTAQIIQPAVTGTAVAADEDDRPQPSGFIIIDGLTTSSTSSRTVSTTVSYAPITIYQEEISSQSENLNVNFSTGGEIAPFHDEYLSSSQELLRQIQSGYPTSTETFNRTQTVVPTRKNKHFTPLKVGSMAAACILAGGAIYTSLNPTILTTLTATKVAVPVTTSSVIQTPNLAANEFTELNLSTLNNIKLPTVVAAAPTTNVSIATSSIGATATAPAPVPFTRTPVVPTATITSQPKLADSLIKSLLPPNFQSYAKPSGYRSIPSGLKR